MNRSTEPWPFPCTDGLIVRCWPTDGSLVWTTVHASVYLCTLLYLFVGIAIIADRFMAAIEVITSQQRDVVVRGRNTGHHHHHHHKETISVRVWNQTVSNLTLMALGSSAPEILLSLLEVWSRRFEAGDLGPGTIVGSAAFNMLVTVGVCVVAVPDTEVRRVKFLRVFLATLVVAIGSQLWLLAILVWISPGIVELWEAVVTLALFFVTIAWAYVADRRLLLYKYLDKRYRLRRKQRSGGGSGGSKKAGAYHRAVFAGEERNNKKSKLESRFAQIAGIITIVKRLAHKHPSEQIDRIESLARMELQKCTPKSHAHYRLMAAQCYFGSDGDIVSSDQFDYIDQCDEDDFVDVHFDPTHYSVVENERQVRLTVTRVGDATSALVVTYETRDGSAKAGVDYVGICGVLELGPGETHQQIIVELIENDIYEEDKQFTVKLLTARYRFVATLGSDRPRATVRLRNSLATVTVLDDDHAGVFAFDASDCYVQECNERFELSVVRYRGARGSVDLTYHTVAGSAKAGKHFCSASGVLHFDNNESRKMLTIGIVNEMAYEKNVCFYVQIDKVNRTGSNQSQPCTAPESPGAPRLGPLSRCAIHISESEKFRRTVNNLLKNDGRNGSDDYVIGDRDWEDQMLRLFQVRRLNMGLAETNRTEHNNNNKDIEQQQQQQSENGNNHQRTTAEYLVHWTTFVWRCLALTVVPPPTLANGWPTFAVSIAIIGVLTAFIADLASHLGATVHLPDSITALVVVTLGTSLPDTLASVIAARREPTADAALGNVTGSTAVSVFLGIGLAWTTAAVHHWRRGSVFRVAPTNVAFEVALFGAAATVAAVVLLVRRAVVGGEFGGPTASRLVTLAIMTVMWLFYIVMATLHAYGVFTGF